jgi:succinylglutamate desuccinylase
MNGSVGEFAIVVLPQSRIILDICSAFRNMYIYLVFWAANKHTQRHEHMCYNLDNKHIDASFMLTTHECMTDYSYYKHDISTSK